MNTDCYVCGMGTGICGPCGRQIGVSPTFPARIGGDDDHVRSEPGPDEEPDVVLDPPRPGGQPFTDLDIEPNGRYTGKEKETIERVEKLGFTVVRGTGTDLLLDLDSGVAVKRFNDLIGMFDAKFPIKAITWWFSKSGAPRTHVKLSVKKWMSTEERVGLEMALGSDPKRGMLNFHKNQRQDEEPSLLFRPPGAIVVHIMQAPWQIIP